MTEERAMELYKACPPDKLHFSGYYKYRFSFVGENHCLRFRGSRGGNADEIYRMTIAPEEAAPRADELRDYFSYFHIINKLTGEEFEWYEPL